MPTSQVLFHREVGDAPPAGRRQIGSSNDAPPTKHPNLLNAEAHAGSNDVLVVIPHPEHNGAWKTLLKHRTEFDAALTPKCLCGTHMSICVDYAHMLFNRNAIMPLRL